MKILDYQVLIKATRSLSKSSGKMRDLFFLKLIGAKTTTGLLMLNMEKFTTFMTVTVNNS
jgi:hypothetical protein